MKGFTKSEVILILELARLALGDAENFDRFADALDIKDEDLFKLRTKIEDVTKGLP